MARFKLYLFGPPRLERDGQPVEINLRKALALLVYLAGTRQAHSRDALATLFWPEKDQQAARANLRRTLYDLGQLLGEQVLDVTPETVCLPVTSALWVDTETFQACLEGRLAPHPQTLDAAALQALLTAADLYTDDFLAGFTLPDCPLFDDWQFFQREELRRSFAMLLQQLVHTYQEQKKYEEAIRYARRWLLLDPLDEPVQRRLIQLYALAGQPSAALRQFEECVRILESELSVAPEAETTALYEAIRTRRFPVGDRTPGRLDAKTTVAPAPSSATGTPGALASSRATTSFSHNLPTPASPFVGREVELEEVLGRCQDPACRLLVLIGPGGMGKTRLAIEVARRLADAQETSGAFLHGIFFVPLQTVNEPEEIVSAIAEAMGFHFHGDGSPRRLLLDHLQKKQLFLVLDNFEHLLAGAGLISDMLAAAPGIKLLVTSRAALDLQEAWSYQIAGLRFPQDDAGQKSAVAAYDAVRFFMQCARQASGGFSFEGELEQIVRICRLVGGAPLALELAASWVKVLPCQAIGDEIERSLDILTARTQNMPARHRSMRMVLEQTWQQLTEPERIILSGLSIFRGDSSRHAAEQVTGATLPVLTALVDKALLHLTTGGRYGIHELVRQYAQEQMRALPGQQEQILARHCAYYTSFLRQQIPNLKLKRQKEAFAEIIADLANIRAAWQYAVAQQNIQALEDAAEALWLFSDARGAFREGETIFQQAVTAFTAQRPAAELPEEQKHLVGFLLAGQGYLRYRRGDWKQGRPLMEQGLELLQQTSCPAKQKLAMVLLYLGWIVTSRREYEKAQQLGQKSLALFTEVDDRWGIVACKELMSQIAMLTGPLIEAERQLQEGLALSTACEADKLRGGFQHKLGDIAIWLGKYVQARQHLEEAQNIAQSIGALPGLNNTLRELGRLAICQGRYNEAIQLFEHCLAIAEEIDPQWAKRSMLIFLATAHRLLGNLTEAERIYQDCLQTSQANDIQTCVASSSSGLGLLAAMQGELYRAEKLHQEALAIWKKLGYEPEVASELRYLGHLIAASDENRLSEARHCYCDALQLALKHGLAPIVLDIFVGAAQLLPPGATQRARELLALAEHHPASTYETQVRARQRLEELATNTPDTPVAYASNRSLDWQSTAQHLIEELSDPNWNQVSVIVDNLPPQPTPFVGRANELREIHRCLRMPACRLLTIVGPGGIGKTRLALQVAQQIVDEERQCIKESSLPPGEAHTGARLPDFADGIFFVPLQTVSTESGAISAIADATGFHFYSDTPPRQQLLNFLREKQMLLVLDSMEQVAEGTMLVSEILARAPGVKLLVTTQKPLNLYEEWFHPLAGMMLPVGNRSSLLAPTGDFGNDGIADAVQLFVQSARRARVDFTLEGQQEHVARICRLVDGMPLAIELAAAWLKVLPCPKIADEIERSLDILTTRHQNIPARHHSMRAVLEQTWLLLDQSDQDLLMRLSVFRGGFSQEAAAEVAGATLPMLATLVEKALVWVTPSGRYHMHELLRLFAQEQWKQNPQEEIATRTRHSTYYLRSLSKRGLLLLSKARRLALEEIGREIDNLRAAWQWAVQQGNLAILSQAVEPLYHFYQIQSRYQEGKELFVQTWMHLQQENRLGEGASLAVAPVRILARCGAFCYFLCEYETASQYLQEALARAQALNHQAEIAYVLNFLGQIAIWQGEKAIAREYLLKSLAICQETGDKSGAASALDKLANLVYATFGEYIESKRLALQSLALSRELGHPDWIAYALDTLGFLTFCLGEYGDAETYYRESLELFEAIDDQYGIAMAQGGIGLVLWAMWEGKYVEATAYLQKSLSICRTIGHQGQIAGRLAGLARIANDLGEYEHAQELALEGLAIARELGSPIYLSHILYCLGESAYGMGDLPASRAYLMEALHVASEVGLLAYLAIALFHYAILLIKESQKDVTQSAQKQEKALELLALVQSSPAAWQVYKDRAARRLAELESQLPPEVVAAAKARGTTRTLDEVVAELQEDEKTGAAIPIL